MVQHDPKIRGDQNSLTIDIIFYYKTTKIFAYLIELSKKELKSETTIAAKARMAYNNQRKEKKTSTNLGPCCQKSKEQQARVVGIMAFLEEIGAGPKLWKGIVETYME